MTAFDNDRWEAERKARLERVGGGMTPLEKAARAVDPAAWAFYDKWIGAYPTMQAEATHEVGPSLMKARAVLMAVRETDWCLAASAGLNGKHEYIWPGELQKQFAAMIDAILAEPQP